MDSNNKRKCPTCDSQNIFINDLTGKCRCRECGEVFYVEVENEASFINTGSSARKAYLKDKEDKLAAEELKAKEKEIAKKKEEENRRKNEEQRKNEERQLQIILTNAKPFRIRHLILIIVPLLLIVISLCMIPKFPFITGWLVFLLLTFIFILALFIFNCIKWKKIDYTVKPRVKKNFIISIVTFVITVASSGVALGFIISKNIDYDGYDKGYYYKNNETGVTALLNYSDTINVPETLDGKKVTIAELNWDYYSGQFPKVVNVSSNLEQFYHAYQLFKNVEQINFPSNCNLKILHLEQNKNLYNISLPASVREFYADSSNLKSVSFAGPVERIILHDSKLLTFVDCRSGSSDLIFNFYNCSSLSSVNLPVNLRQIGNHAFSDCKNLNLNTIPNTVQSIGEQAFYNCSQLTFTSLPSNLKIVKESAFNGVNDVITKLPSSIESIGDKAFFGCKSIEFDIFPKNVSLGANCFSGNTKIKKITCYDDGDWHNSSIFGNDNNTLEEIIIKKNFNFSSGLFHQLKGLKKVTWEGGNNELDEAIDFDFKFGSQYGGGAKDFIENIYVPSGKLDDFCFSNMNNLTTLVLGRDVSSIGWSCFEYTNKLTRINYEGSISQWNNVKKSIYYNYGAQGKTVVCSDGEVQL